MSCGITNIALSQLTSISQVRSFKYISDELQTCLAQLRIDTNSDYAPWSDLKQFNDTIRTTLAILFLPILVWYIIIYVLQLAEKWSNSKSTEYSVVDDEKSIHLLRREMKSILEMQGIEFLNFFNGGIWILSGVCSIIALIARHPTEIIRYIIIYENRALVIIALLQITVICQGLSLFYGQIKLYFHYKQFEDHVLKSEFSFNPMSELVNPISLTDTVIDEFNVNSDNMFPSEQYLSTIYKEYVLYTWNIILFIILNGFWIGIWTSTDAPYYTSSISLALLIFSLLIVWFIIWYPFHIKNWYQEPRITIPMGLWSTVLFLSGTSLLYNNSTNSLVFLYTNDSYNALWVAPVVIILIQVCVMLCLMAAIIQNSTFIIIITNRKKNRVHNNKRRSEGTELIKTQ
jgi:hypothetical protein